MLHSSDLLWRQRCMISHRSYPPDFYPEIHNYTTSEIVVSSHKSVMETDHQFTIVRVKKENLNTKMASSYKDRSIMEWFIVTIFFMLYISLLKSVVTRERGSPSFSSETCETTLSNSLHTSSTEKHLKDLLSQLSKTAFYSQMFYSVVLLYEITAFLSLQRSLLQSSLRRWASFINLGCQFECQVSVGLHTWMFASTGAKKTC